jgi:AcrR family transcriptional regulator
MAIDRRPPEQRLPRGPSALDPEDRARLHRERVQDALVTLVAERGLPETSIRDICAQARVAPRDLYAQYAGKQELLLGTCDAIVREARDAIAVARRTSPPPIDTAEAVAAVLLPLAKQAAARPAHAHLVLVDVFAAGAVGPPYRRALVAHLRTLLADALSDLPGPAGVSEASLWVVAAGSLQVFERRVRAGRARGLPKASAELARWAAGYRTASPLPLPKPGRPTPLAPANVEPRGLPRNTQRLPRQFVVPHQRERILRAVTALAAREGYAEIGIPAIASEAQISIRTFYQHFPSKHDAFIAVYDLAFGKLFARTWAAASGQRSWNDAVREGVRAWVAYVANEPELARFGFSDMLTVGRDAVERVDNAYYAFGDLFGRGRPGEDEVSELVSYAIAGGIAGLVASWVADGHASDIQQLAPHLTYAVLAPTSGDAEALHVSGLAPVPVVVPVPEPGDDGQRIAAAFAELVAEQGYAATTLEQAADRAGVDQALVGEYFDDPADCALQALDAWTDRTFAAMAAAFASAPRDGALAVHRALGAMLAQMAAEPALLHLAVEAVEQLGPRALARRARYASVFFDAIAPTIAPDDPIPARPRVVSEMLAEAVFGVLRTYVTEDRIDELPAALPEISYLSVAPFFGPERAAEIAQLPFAAGAAVAAADAEV